MSVERYTFDTNVLFYALDTDAGKKFKIAQQLLANADYNHAVILLQTLGELSHAVRRKAPSKATQANQFIETLMETFPVIPSLNEDLLSALAVNARHNFPFWDAMVWATARRSSCSIILTEDFQGGRALNGVTFRDPFQMSPTELSEFLT